MYVEVNGRRLFVDIEGAGLIPDGPEMRQKPTLILLHGGPGADHSIYKPSFSALSDLCQIVYYDHLGNGRSDEGTPAEWTLARWGQDVKALCDALGIARPIVYGASFGGVVAQSYAVQYPDHPCALILSATAAKTDFESIYRAFSDIGGETAGAVARAYWSDPTPEGRAAYFETCLPLYTRAGFDPDVMARMIVKNPVGMHYNGPSNEQGRFDFRKGLGTIPCPSLILSGSHDPVMPHVFGAEIAQHLPDNQFVLVEGAAHMIEADAPEAFHQHLRQFIMSLS